MAHRHIIMTSNTNQVTNHTLRNQTKQTEGETGTKMIHGHIIMTSRINMAYLENYLNMQTEKQL